MIRSTIRRLFRTVVAAGPIAPLAERSAEALLCAVWNEDLLDMRRNGEAGLLRRLAAVGWTVSLAIDVGASRGDWTAEARRAFPSAVVYCFEIVPETAEKLRVRFLGDQRVRVIDRGLSDREGTVAVTCFRDSDSVSAIQPLLWQAGSYTMPCSVVRGGDYLEHEGTDRLDILKIDTEGHDLSVLRGFEAFLKRNAVPVIQFEYGRMLIPSRALLADFYDLLLPLGYRVGRLFPKGVRFKPYDFFRDEHYRNGNYVAVHESCGELIEALSLR